MFRQLPKGRVPQNYEMPGFFFAMNTQSIVVSTGRCWGVKCLEDVERLHWRQREVYLESRRYNSMCQAKMK